MSMLKRAATKKMGPGQIEMAGNDITLNRGMNGMPLDEYSEKPRPNLYNVLKKLREQKGKMYHRICIVSKFDEGNMRGDIEK